MQIHIAALSQLYSGKRRCPFLIRSVPFPNVFSRLGIRSRQAILLLIVGVLQGDLSAQLRIVSYNTTSTVNEGLGEVLQAIAAESVNGIERKIDILALQEQENQRVQTQAIVDLMNEIYGQDVYARGELNGAGFFTQGVIYNTQTVELIREKRVGSVSARGAPRQALRYQFRPNGYNSSADFYIYNSHFKANDTEKDAERRAVEAKWLRADAEQLGDDANVIYLGDYNLYSDREPAFQTLIQPGTAQAFDPIDRVGSWSRSGRFIDVHTQSTTVRGGENRAGGGMNDRFDFQLLTSPMLDGEGVSYIGPNVPDLSEPVTSESYRAFGNNGTHFRDRNISTGTGASAEVLQALETASDHLPVVADYQLPAKMEVQIQYAQRVLVGADAVAEALVRNAAPVSISIAADELEYSISSLAGIAINEQGVAIATEDPNVHRFALPTESVGTKTPSVVVSSSSEQVPVGLISHQLTYDVLSHANGSFSQNDDTDAWRIDLGMIPPESGSVPFEFTIHNLASDDPGFTADLFLQAAEMLDSPFRIELPQVRISAADSHTFSGVFDPSSAKPGLNRAEFVIESGDEPLPGASAGDELVIFVTAQIGAALIGDFNGDQRLGIEDIQLLTSQVFLGDQNEVFDLNGDQVVDAADRTYWVERIKLTYFGDTNLDGEFDSSDLTAVFVAAEYRDELEQNSSWMTGDWDGDLEFDTSDLVLAFQSGGYEQGRRDAAQVPEPKCFPGWLFVLLVVICLRNYSELSR